MTISDSNDFINNALADFSTSVTWTPRTKTIGNRGDRTFSNGTPQVINVVLHRNKLNESQEKQAELKNRTGYVMYDPQYSIGKDDLITFGTEIWQVKGTVVRGAAETIDVYGYGDIFLTNA